MHVTLFEKLGVARSEVQVMNLRRWFAWRQWPWLPVPIRRWQKQYQEDAIYQMLAPRVFAAQAAGVGITESHASSEITQLDVLEWIPKQFVASPNSSGQSTDVVKILIAHCTEQQFASVEAGVPLHLPSTALVVHWFGARSSWYWEGHDAVQQALPERHDGLYIAVNNVGVAFAAASPFDARHTTP